MEELIELGWSWEPGTGDRASRFISGVADVNETDFPIMSHLQP